MHLLPFVGLLPSQSVAALHKVFAGLVVASPPLEMLLEEFIVAPERHDLVGKGSFSCCCRSCRRSMTIVDCELVFAVAYQRLDTSRAL